jgi:hypothetical protein
MRVISLAAAVMLTAICALLSEAQAQHLRQNAEFQRKSIAGCFDAAKKAKMPAKRRAWCEGK